MASAYEYSVLSRCSLLARPVCHLQRCKRISLSRRSQCFASANAAPIASASRQPPITTSTSSAQPFSVPIAPSPSRLKEEGLPPEHSNSKQASAYHVPSSAPAGMSLKGLTYFKDKEDPVAMEDHEYPEWLWDVLTVKEKPVGSKEDSDPRLYAKSAKTRRKANKRARARELMNLGAAEDLVPLNEQTVDLPHDNTNVSGAIEAAQSREELTYAMRQKRRSDIKEANYLRGMR